MTEHPVCEEALVDYRKVKEFTGYNPKINF
jgi:hypothetical protein